MRKLFTTKAFTLVEVMVVVILLGIIAAFAIPNYQRSLERAYRRDATAQLNVIHGANRIYRAQNGGYWPSASGQNVAAINAALGLNIIENGVTYTASGNGSDTFTVTAVRTGSSAFTLTLTQVDLSSSNPSCSGSCS